jgi:signal transduction histidine kinase
LTAFRFTALLLLAAAACVPEVDTRVTPAHLLSAAVGVTTAIGALGGLLGGPPSGLFTPAAFGTAGGCVWSARRRGQPLLAWAGLVALALAVPGLAPGGWTEAGWGQVAAVLVAGGCALVGGVVSLRDAFVVGRRPAEASNRHQSAAVRGQRETQEELVHEAANALSAIDGASRMLGLSGDAAARPALLSGLRAEIARLRLLLSTPVAAPVESGQREPVAGGSDPKRGRSSAGMRSRFHEPFVVADLLASQAVLGACQGISVRSYARHDLVAIGSVADTAQVLANLLANVLRYAPGSALDLRGEQDGEWITVRVEDRGPGIPPGERARLLLRGARGAAGSDVAGSGLGLYVAARLMRGQGGDLRIEDRPGGGTSVVLTLQTAPAGSVRPEGLQSLQRGGEVPGRALVEADQTNLADRRGRGLEPSDGLFGDHPGGLGARVSEDAR